VWNLEGPFNLVKHLENGELTVYPATNFSTSIQDFKESNYKGQVDKVPSATGVGRQIWPHGVYEG